MLREQAPIARDRRGQIAPALVVRGSFKVALEARGALVTATLHALGGQ